ncbi:MAG: M42 family metallopeptidase [Aerococcaceae bacterium]|nr:M42 family metallopeptidase [Aerococcaceae bacterium]
MKQTIDYIQALTAIPSPTGYTHLVMDYITQELTQFGYAVTRTAKGGVIVTVEGQNKTEQRMITAHVDTLGAMVKSIQPDGRLKLVLIGGFAYASIEGENCIIHVAKNNRQISGTILMHQASVHVYSDARTAERNQANMEVRLDEKVTTAEETRALGIEVGDFISFDTRTIVTDSGFIKSRHLDDKVSAAILLNQLRQYAQNGTALSHTTHFYFSPFEEVGHGANSSIPQEVVEFLAVDMGAMGDGQQTDEYSVSICAKDSSGPYHYGLRQHLVALANENNIPYQIDIYPYYGSDASAALSAGAEVRHGLIGAGIESSHSYERTHMESVEATERLVEAYLLSPMPKGVSA